MKVRVLAFLFSLFYFSGVAQILTPVTVNSASGSGGAGGYIFDWNIGDVVVTTVTNPNIIVTQGFLQNNVAVPTSVGNLTPLSAFEIKLLPNPTPNRVLYRFSMRERGRIQMRLYDLTGKSLLNTQAQHNGGVHNGQLDMSALPSGVYQLHILFTPVSGAARQGVYQLQKVN
jgi:Secretion system C-terminal sorting domain